MRTFSLREFLGCALFLALFIFFQFSFQIKSIIILDVMFCAIVLDVALIKKKTAFWKRGVKFVVYFPLCHFLSIFSYLISLYFLSALAFIPSGFLPHNETLMRWHGLLFLLAFCWILHLLIPSEQL